MILDYRGHNVITRVLKSARGRLKSQSESVREGDGMDAGSDGRYAAGVKTEEGASSQGVQVASGSQKDKGLDFPLEPPERSIALPTP